ncbi:MAG: hypothetical protein ABI682_05540 [Acidobacteriota bacterium]
MKRAPLLFTLSENRLPFVDTLVYRASMKKRLPEFEMPMGNAMPPPGFPPKRVELSENASFELIS